MPSLDEEAAQVRGMLAATIQTLRLAVAEPSQQPNSSSSSAAAAASAAAGRERAEEQGLQPQQLVGDIRAAQQGFRERFSQLLRHNRNLEAAIQELAERVRAAKEEAEVPKAAAEHAAEVTELRDSQEAASNSAQAAIDALREVRRQLAEAQQEQQQLEQQRRAIEEMVNVEMPTTRTKIWTYASISHIKWDYEAPEDHLKGEIRKAKEGDIIPFDFDLSSESQWDIVNKLWDMI